MSLVRDLIRTVRETLRYKLLVLVLFPILLIMPIALILAIYWGTTITYDQLFIKVNTDLSVSNDIFRRIREDYLAKLGRLTESYAFRTALEAGADKSIHQQLSALKNNSNLSYLQLLGTDGRRLHGTDNEEKRHARASPSLLTALQGQPRVGIEIFSSEDLYHLSPELAAKVSLPLIKTPRARPTNKKSEERGMMIRALYPVKDSRGTTIAVLDGGVLLNDNFTFVDTIRDLVYGKGSLPEGSIGTVTVFLDDVRITTNVPLRPGERALGTRVSDEVRTLVLDHGELWIARAFVVNDWYISSYEPIIDVNGERVGMLYAGFLETPFRNSLWRALAVLILFFVILMLFSSLLAIRGAKSIFKPLELMSAVVRATRDGEARRIGKVDSQDEIGELAREFDTMLDLLRERNQQIQHWAGQLEHKVEERTAELQQKNDDLHRTIHVLRETREQLVVAEKLAALGQLTAGVAHEINNPTAVMLGNLDVLVAELGSAADPVRHEINLVIEQIYRIKEIINNLLQYSKPDEYAGYISRIDVNEVVQHTFSLVRHMRKKEPFDIELELKATRSVEINEKELQQVLVNLVANGVHALEKDKGLIRMTTSDWGDKGVMISIQDNGTGMEQDQLSRIFNPFYSTSVQGEGTGLGLSVSYGLIRRYGGNITVESKLGKGSTFFVWLLEEPVLVNDEETIAEQLHAIESDQRIPGMNGDGSHHS